MRPPRGQGALVSFIGRIRANTARFTDERVRLAGEAIAGSLAVKMLGAPSKERYCSSASVVDPWCTSAGLKLLTGCAHHVLAPCEGAVCCAPCFYHCFCKYSPARYAVFMRDRKFCITCMLGRSSACTLSP
jgi:hypothetical protein